MEWVDVGTLNQPVTWLGVLAFAFAVLRWLLRRGDDLKTEVLQELRKQRDEYRDRAQKAEKLVRAYHRRHGPLPEAAVTGSVSVADIMEHIRLHDDDEQEL